MRAGELLKEYRLRLGLTQEEMAAGIVSKSFYSKIENGLHNLDSETLIEILMAHKDKIDFQDFFIRLRAKYVNEAEENKYVAKVISAFNENRSDKFDEIETQIKKSGLENEALEAVLYAARAIYEGQSFIETHPAPKIILRRKEALTKIENWDGTTYENLSFTFMLLEKEQRKSILLEAIKSFQKTNIHTDVYTRDYSNMLGNSLLGLWREDPRKNEELIRIIIDAALKISSKNEVSPIKDIALYYQAKLDHDEKFVQAMEELFRRKGVKYPQ